MKLIDYIENKYGKERGYKAAFLRDNPQITPQALTRFLSIGSLIDLSEMRIYSEIKSIKLNKSLTL